MFSIFFLFWCNEVSTVGYLTFYSLSPSTLSTNNSFYPSIIFTLKTLTISKHNKWLQTLTQNTIPHLSSIFLTIILKSDHNSLPNRSVMFLIIVFTCSNEPQGIVPPISGGTHLTFSIEFNVNQLLLRSGPFNGCFLFEQIQTLIIGGKPAILRSWEILELFIDDLCLLAYMIPGCITMWWVNKIAKS